MGLILILQTIILSLYLGFILKSFWFLYLLILVFIGGILVLFIYVTSIFPNEKFYFTQNTPLLLILLIFILLLSIILIDQIFGLNSTFEEFKISIIPIENNAIYPTSKIFSSQTNIILIFLVNYLFYCIIVVIKVTNLFKGPLRKITYVHPHTDYPPPNKNY